MNEKVAQALSHVDEKYVAQAARRKKRHYTLKAAVAAVLVLAFLFHIPTLPLAVTAKAVSIAPESRKADRPRPGTEEFRAWYDEQELRRHVAEAAAPAVAVFAENCSGTILAGTDSVNRLWSPINAYIALAVTAELAGGSTRDEVLSILGKDSLETLRMDVSAMWETIYSDDGREISVLANSLWLDKDVGYVQQTMDDIAYHYYASVYQGDLGSRRTNRAMTNWLNNQTGGMLKDRTGSLSVDPESLLALASTVYFQAQWHDQFDSADNTEDVFHAADGDITCTYMNAEEYHANYYWAEDYGAVQLFLKNGAMMWLILPDEDKTTDDVLRGGDYMNMITRSVAFPEENHKYMNVNLSLPKFDVSASTDLEDGLKNAGLTNIFEPLGNDFSPSIISDVPVYLDSINQDTRVTIDEEGVTAASYVLLQLGAGAAAPPDDTIDFVLDRPFLFAITSSNIPLFTGVVNMP